MTHDDWEDWHCHKKRLTAAAWGRAIYVDFEGTARPADTPVLLGAFFVGSKGSVHRRFVFDDSCARASRASQDDCEVADPRAVAAELIDLSNDERRPIVSWSCHDIRWIKRLTDGRAFRYRNAIATAKRWRRRYRPGESGDNSLARFLDWVGYERSDSSQFEVGRAIRRIRRTQSVTKGVVQVWRELVKHNDDDLAGMREVLRVATAPIR